MDKKIMVLGTGAIGSSIGADMTRAGQNVVLVDQWPAHVEAMKANGIRVITPAEDVLTPVKAFHLCQVRELMHMFDIVFLTAKSYDSTWLVECIKPYLKADGVVVSVQNCLNDEQIAPIVGYERDVGCVVELSAEVFEPGIVKRNTDQKGTWFALGELHGRVTPRLEALAKILGAAGKTEITTNIWGAKWSKLTVNCMHQAIMGILGIREWEAIKIPEVFDFCIELGRESLQVGTALGYRMEPIFGMTPEEFLGSTDDTLKKILTTLVTHIGKEARNSILQDHLKGRKSEGDLMNGLVVQKGKRAGIPTPMNEAMVALTRQIEQKQLKPDRQNMRLLEELRDRQSA